MQRLLTRAEFQAVMAAPVVARSAHFALHRLPSPPVAPDPQAAAAVRPAACARVGAVTPKRLARRAVTRNTLKRQIYAVSEALLPELPPAWYVVRLRTGFARNDFPSATSSALKRLARAEIAQLWQQLSPAGGR